MSDFQPKIDRKEKQHSYKRVYFKCLMKNVLKHRICDKYSRERKTSKCDVISRTVTSTAIESAFQFST